MSERANLDPPKTSEQRAACAVFEGELVDFLQALDRLGSLRSPMIELASLLLLKKLDADERRRILTACASWGVH